MDPNMKKLQQALIEIETEAEHLLLARHQMVENDRIRNGNREALTALRRKARTTKNSVSSPFEVIMKELEGAESRPLVREICSTCGSCDPKEHTWMMFPGTDTFARLPFHAAHTILEKGIFLTTENMNFRWDKRSICSSIVLTVAPDSHWKLHKDVWRCRARQVRVRIRVKLGKLTYSWLPSSYVVLYV